MKRILALLSLLALSATLPAQQAPKPYGSLPSPTQLKWHEMEMYCLVHFGVNTYLDHEWGYGDEDPGLINPVHFDARQIVSAAKAGGFKGVIIVAKHHDGLCFWPTKTTSHSIMNSPYKNGEWDMVKEYRQACNQLGMQMGIYCSPWDRNNPQYGKPDYLKIYQAQLKELYTGYGPYFMIWHDGANGGNGYYGGAKETRKIDRTTYYDWDHTWAIARKMQPTAAIFGDLGPDVRWIGNEDGIAGETCWATYTPHAPDAGKKPANGYAKTEEATEGTRNGEFWMPAECDVPLRPGWFYHASQNSMVRTASQLLDIYYASVGRGADLDLGLAPNQDGLLDSTDVQSLKTFGNLLKQTFAVNLAHGARLKASNIRGNNARKFGPQYLLDNDRYTYWATDDQVKQPELLVDLHSEKTFNIIRLRENIKLGQRIGSLAVDAYLDGEWKEIAAATSIGSNRLIRLTKDIRTTKVRLRITSSPVCIALSDFGLYKEPEHFKAPVISRDKSGRVDIQSSNHQSIVRYTLNGTDPVATSMIFSHPLSLPDGGVIKARVFSDKLDAGDINTRIYGPIKSGWKVVSIPDSTDAGNLIDDDENTTWSTVDNTLSFPQEVVIDMGKVQTVKAFTYLPRQDKKTAGLIDQYKYLISMNGKDWQLVKAGEFSNMEANPVQQQVILPQAVNTRYFKFLAVHTNHGKGVSIAELGIIK